MISRNIFYILKWNKSFKIIIKYKFVLNILWNIIKYKRNIVKELIDTDEDEFSENVNKKKTK